MLIACAAPLQGEYGAGQMALNLAEALRGRGHQVDVWTPAEGRWWSRHRQMRRELDAFLGGRDQYDVVDAPAYLITRVVGRTATVVARSVQPELLYLYVDRRHDASRIPFRPVTGIRALARWSAYLVYDLGVALLVLAGWRRATHILCLGSLEFAWMHRRLPMLRPKLHRYLNALGPRDQRVLSAVRSRRQPSNGPTRFLWIGRWSAHKGTRALLRFIEDRVARFPTDRFTVAGYGTISDRDARTLSAVGTVTLIPRFARDSLPELLAKHDVGLFTSEIEGWGLVLNEMIEAGLTVYAMEAGGVPDLRPHTNAIEPFPPPPRAQVTTTSSLGRDYYQHFSWSAIAEQYEHDFMPPSPASTVRPVASD